VVSAAVTKYSQLYDAGDLVGTATAIRAKVQEDITTVVIPVVRDSAAHVYETVVTEGLALRCPMATKVVGPTGYFERAGAGIVEGESWFEAVAARAFRFLFVGWCSIAGLLILVGIWQLVLHVFAFIGLTVVLMTIRQHDQTGRNGISDGSSRSEVRGEETADGVSSLSSEEVAELRVGGFWTQAVDGTPRYIVNGDDIQERFELGRYEDARAMFDEIRDGSVDHGYTESYSEFLESVRERGGESEDVDRYEEEQWARDLERSYGVEESRDEEGYLEHGGELCAAFQFYVDGGTRHVAMEAADFKPSMSYGQSDPFPQGWCYMLLFPERLWSTILATQSGSVSFVALRALERIYGLSDDLVRYRRQGTEVHIVRHWHAKKGFSQPISAAGFLKLFTEDNKIVVA